MKISGVDIRPGNILEYEGGIWKVAKIQHTQPGKGGAYMQVEMKNLQDGRKTNVRFRSADTVERVRLDQVWPGDPGQRDRALHSLLIDGLVEQTEDGLFALAGEGS